MKTTTTIINEGDYLTDLLSYSVLLHLHHLKTSSYAAHVALGELYEGLTDKVDGLAEVYTGCFKRLPRYPQNPSFPQNSTDPIELVSKIYEYAEENRDLMGDESQLQNIVDEILAQIEQTRYKLMFLK